MSNSWPDCEGFKAEGCHLDDKETDLSVADSENNPLEREHWLKRQVGGFYLYDPYLERMWVSSIRTKRQDGLLIRFFYLGENRTSHIVVMWGDQEPLGSRLYTLPPDAITDTNRDFFFWTSWYGGPAFVEVERGPRDFPPLVLHKEKSVCIAGDFGLTKAIDKRTGDIYWLVGDKEKNYHEILFKEGPKVSEPLKCELKETPTASGEFHHDNSAFQTIMGEVKHERLLTPSEHQYAMFKQGVLDGDKLEQSQTTIQKTLEDLAKEVAGLRKLQVEHFNELSESIREMYERNFSQELAEFSELMEDVSDLEDTAKISQSFQMKDMHRLVTNTLIGMVRDAKEMSIQSFIEEFLKGASLRLKD